MLQAKRLGLAPGVSATSTPLAVATAGAGGVGGGGAGAAGSGGGGAAAFLGKAVAPPTALAIAAGLEELIRVGALDSASEQLTALGGALGALPLAPRLAKMVVLAQVPIRENNDIQL